MTIKFFKTQADFRTWLEKNHEKETELTVGFYKVGSGKPSMTWSESVDHALCFGWIDGIRKRIDEESYCIRFTPRRPGSNWSAINIAKIEELSGKGLMHPAGEAAYADRREDRSRIYTYENKPRKLPPVFEKIFKADKDAWKFFSSQPPSYQRTVMFWIMSAKQEATQLSRLQKTIAASQEHKRL